MPRMNALLLGLTIDAICASFLLLYRWILKNWAAKIFPRCLTAFRHGGGVRCQNCTELCEAKVGDECFLYQFTPL